MLLNKKPKIVLFYSPQGGTGKSTLAINTAIFASIQGMNTLLMDMSVYGSVMSSLKIPQKGGNGLSSIITLLDLDVGTKETLKFNQSIKGSIVKSNIHNNLDVLIGANPVKMESLSEKHTREIIKGVKGLNYDFIVIDTSSELSVKNLILFELVDYILVPVIQDVSCGWKLILFKEVVEKYILDKDKIRLIINMCSKHSGFNSLEFESEIGFGIMAEIPLYLKRFQNFINKGDQIYLKYNKKAYKRFRDLTKEILDMM